MTLGSALAVAAIGAVVGFLSGMFGKGGSAVATPMLAALGIPEIAAVASPLPATIPTTVAAASAYWRDGQIDRRIVAVTVAAGVPATILGPIATRWVDTDALILLTDLLLAGLGLRVLVGSDRKPAASAPTAPPAITPLLVIALTVGFASGLLANSGGALLAPLYLTVLHLPIKRTFASSLTAATALAIPSTLIHTILGHIDWSVVVVFSIASMPLAFVGARLALRTQAARLERAYGVVLIALGLGFAIVRLAL